MPKPNPLSAPHAAELLHLDDEDVALLAEGAPLDAALREHARVCADCAERVQVARAILCIEPLHGQADPGRVASLLARLEGAGALAPAPSERAAPQAAGFIAVVLDDQRLRVVRTNTEVRIPERAVATRSSSPNDTPGVAFFRAFEDLQVEVHLVRVPDGRFHLVVGLVSPDADAQWRIGLHRGRRQLQVELAPHNTATFKSLRPASYRLEIHDRGACRGVVEVHVHTDGEDAPC